MNNTITAAKGFWAVGFASGAKKSGKLDLGIISCPTGATAAAMFTTNSVFAAPVGLCRKHVTGKKIYAAIVNSGNANACTSKKGFKDAVAMCEQTASHFGCDPHQVLIASTGIIGDLLPL
jgi:glutamate N-acetyltransferase/amino-acid N-acetyltransferase